MKKYSDEQVDVLKQAYPVGDWDTIFQYFPNTNKTAIKGYANKHGIYKNKKDCLSYKDLTGKKYNMLTAEVPDKKRGSIVYWRCRCDCGNATSVPIYALVKGVIKSCGCLKHKAAVNSKDFTGMRFGMLTAVERLPRYRENKTFYKCQCDCGNYKIVYSGNLRSGHTVSCGNHKHKILNFGISNIITKKIKDHIMYIVTLLQTVNHISG